MIAAWNYKTVSSSEQTCYTQYANIGRCAGGQKKNSSVKKSVSFLTFYLSSENAVIHLFRTHTRDGSAKRFSHSHFCPSPSHRFRVAFASHFSHFFRIFALFDLFALCFTFSTPKCSKNCEKKWEKYEKSAKCECHAKMESKFASHYYRKKIRIFALFRIAFASHYHPWPIPLWHLNVWRYAARCKHWFSGHNVPIPFED
jgi:hypothetical protein